MGSESMAQMWQYSMVVMAAQESAAIKPLIIGVDTWLLCVLVQPRNLQITQDMAHEVQQWADLALST